jgi:hypothetical protein
MRFVFLTLFLCGCAAAPKAPAPSSQPVAQEVGYRFWSPTASERSRAEDIARRYAAPKLRLSEAHVAKMKTDSTGCYRAGRRQLFIQFYDPHVFQPLPSGGFEAMMGGFPSYFTVTVDVQDWAVVDHYASRE